MNSARIVAWSLCFLPTLGVGQGVFQKTDTQAEIDLGRAVYEQALRSMRLSQNEAEVKRVQRILDQLQSAMKVRPYPFQAVVVVENEVNASCLPGGYMVVNQGLLVKMPRDEQLALILGHEMGHAVRRHWARKVRRQQNDTLSDAIATVLLGDYYFAPDRRLQYLTFSRDMESESDAFGTELYLRAGFPPDQITSGMQILVDVENAAPGRKAPEYLRTHPDTARRVATIKALAAKLVADGLAPDANGEPIDVSIRKVFGELPSVAADGNPYQPLVPGTAWVYSVSGGAGEASYSVRVVGCADVLSSKVARMETSIGEKTVPYQITADRMNVFRRNRPDKPDSKWAIELMTPDFGGNEISGDTQYHHAALETISTPAGTFENCMKLEIKDRLGRSVTSWYAPAVGLVKRINETSHVTETLSSFRKG